MSGDYSRKTFDPKKHYSGILMQQGRVQLDADWNELVELLDRRWRAETTDILGRCVVSRETPDGFKIEIAADGRLTIGRGRIYVDGLLVENHGAGEQVFDPVLSEQHGSQPTSYDEQPYLPEAPALPEGGTYLVYLDVWQREVSFLEQPELVEKAVGVDTTTRLQTVWQVKILPDVGESVTCAAPDEEILGWTELIRPSAGRLSTATVPVASEPDPCLLPPGGGYQGLENQLYRVEIHEGGPPGTATFKWSRDNATVAAAVIAIPVLNQLIVASLGRDSVLRFKIGDWVEITDDVREFSGQPGLIGKIAAIDDATRTITLEADLPGGIFPTGADGKTDSRRHTRLRRWDQKGEVRDADGKLIIDLDTAGSTGLIPVPAAGTAIHLENGVQVTFNTEPKGGSFRVGDYWVFAARTTDASVEKLNQAPPRGIHHHYCRLAVVASGQPTDCRAFWPPEVEGIGCDCTICVTAESHNRGAQTIQWAIDQIKSTGGTVCLGPGTYNLGEEPLRIVEARSVSIRGQGFSTLLVYTGDQPAVSVANSIGVTLEQMTIVGSGDFDQRAPALLLRNSVDVAVERCIVLDVGSGRGHEAIGLEGYLFGARIFKNALVASIGIGSIGGREKRRPYLFTAGLRIEDNFLWCRQTGIDLGRFSLHYAEARIAGNLVLGCSQAGIAAAGAVLPGSSLNVEGNELRVRGHGIAIGTDGVRIDNNEISTLDGKSGDGIALVAGLYPSGIDRCQILANRIGGITGHGIVIRTSVRSAMIKHNMIEGTQGGGIVMDEGSSAEVLSIENNQLSNIAPREDADARSAVGVRLLNAQQAHLVGNTVKGIGRSATGSSRRAGIQVIASSLVRISGNEVGEVGPAGEFAGLTAGIDVLPTFGSVDVLDNTVTRGEAPEGRSAGANWQAVRIRGSTEEFFTLDDRLMLFPLANAILVVAGSRFRRAPRALEMATVRGNLLEAFVTSVPLADIDVNGGCQFGDNRCLVSLGAAFGTVSLKGFPPLAEVSAKGALVVSGNLFGGPQMATAASLRAPERRFTVLGNVASAPIRMNGQDLGEPWKPLNAIVS